MSNPIFYVYIYLNPLKPGKFTYGEFLSFSFEPFYVGKGKNGQWLSHLKETLKSTHNTHKFYTIQKIKQNGLEPIIIKLNFGLEEDKSSELEIFYIATIGRWGKGLGPLTNHTKGGTGGNTWDGQTNIQKELISRKISAANSGEKNPMYNCIRSDEWRETHSEFMKGDNNPSKRPEVRAKISQNSPGKGLERTINVKLSISNTKKGNCYNQKRVLVNGTIYNSIADATINENMSDYYIKKYISEGKDGFKFL